MRHLFSGESKIKEKNLKSNIGIIYRCKIIGARKGFTIFTPKVHLKKIINFTFNYLKSVTHLCKVPYLKCLFFLNGISTVSVSVGCILGVFVCGLHCSTRNCLLCFCLSPVRESLLSYLRLLFFLFSTFSSLFLLF